jgi:hypothetical protein
MLFICAVNEYVTAMQAICPSYTLKQLKLTLIYELEAVHQVLTRPATCDDDRTWTQVEAAVNARIIGETIADDLITGGCMSYIHKTHPLHCIHCMIYIIWYAK